MKKIVLLSLLFLPGMLAAETLARMTTFFPTPYVAYSRIGANSLSVGTITGTPKLNLGYSGATNYRLQVTDKLIVQKGALKLAAKDAGVEVAPVRVWINKPTLLGTSAGGGLGLLTFHNLRVQDAMQAASIKTDTAIVGILNLFGKQFPSCADAQGATKGKISWQLLKLKGASSNSMYLVCAADN